MGNTAIRAEGLSKQYRIGAARRRHDRLIDALAYRASNLLGIGDRSQADDNLIWALKDVTFEINKGDSVGIIGRNGSGKSTLLKILSRITEPSRGRAAMEGRFCSLLEVGTGFHPELTGRDNIYLSGAILGMKKREIDRKFDEIVAFSEVERFIDTPVKHYSSGMHVRLGFSVIAHMDPEILIVDEVMAVGDGRFQQKCFDKMAEAGKSGRTVLFVSHDMSAIARLCKKAILLEKGRLINEGPAHQVVGEYLYSAGSITPSKEWLDGESAPGNDTIRLRSLRARTEKEFVKDSVDIGESIGIALEFDVLQPGQVLVPCFLLHTEEGVVVFETYDRDPAWARRPRPVGRYVSTAWIPGHLLTEGTLIVNCAIITEAPFREHCHVLDVIAFHVHESGVGISARGDYVGDILGVIRPLLRWTTNHDPAGRGEAPPISG